MFARACFSSISLIFRFDWDTAISEIFGGSEWFYHEMWIKRSWLFSVLDFLCWHVDTVTHLPLKMKRRFTDSVNADSFHMGFWEKSAQVPGKLITNARLMLQKPRDESMLRQHAQQLCYFIIWFLVFFHVSGLITIITVMSAIINNTTLTLPAFVFAAQLTLSFNFFNKVN